MADISKITLPNGSEYNIKDANAVPKTRTINGKDLSQNQTLNAEDIFFDDWEALTGANNVQNALTTVALSQVPVTRTINGYDLTQDRNLTAADVGALPSTGVATTARKLSNDHSFTTTATAGWYKFFEISMAVFTRQTMVICIESTYSQQCSILRINTYRTSSGVANQSIGWIAAGSRHHTVRWEYSGGAWSFYIYKNNDIDTLVFQILARNNDTYGVWDSTKISEPTSAIEVDTIVDVQARFAVSDENGNNIADGVLRFDAVTVSVGTEQQLISISNTKITADYVLARIEFNEPSYITTSYSWTTSAGSFILTGTATAATTANILLVRKGN